MLCSSLFRENIYIYIYRTLTSFLVAQGTNTVVTDKVRYSLYCTEYQICNANRSPNKQSHTWCGSWRQRRILQIYHIYFCPEHVLHSLRRGEQLLLCEYRGPEPATTTRRAVNIARSDASANTRQQQAAPEKARASASGEQQAEPERAKLRDTSTRGQWQKEPNKLARKREPPVRRAAMSLFWARPIIVIATLSFVSSHCDCGIELLRILTNVYL